MAKDNSMKYNIEPIKGFNANTEIKGAFRFHDEAVLELSKFEAACLQAYTRFYLNHDNPKAELEFHQEIKKYRKVFNHNIQEITKHKKFEVIKELNGRIKEYQIN